MRAPFARCIAAFAALSIVALCAFAQDPAKVDELMRKSGLWEQVASLRAQMRAGASQAREEEKAAGRPRAGDADFARLLAAIDAAFEAERMRRVVGGELARRLAPADMDEVLRWLSSDLGRRLTRLEEEASSRDSATLDKDAGRIVAALPQARAALLDRLIHVLDLDARSVDSLGNMTSAIVYGLTLVAPQADPDAAVNGARKRIESQRPALLAYFHRMSVASLAQAYRDVSDEELERYVGFNETPAARRYNDASSRAFEAAIVQGSIEIGRRMGREPLRQERRS